MNGSQTENGSINYREVFLLALLAFSTYSCMYAFRKPFTVATYEGLYFLGIHYKIWLITAQVIGYTSSKFAGIKIISELSHQARPWLILSLIGVAWLALLFFAWIPAPYNIFFLLLNGFPLGLIWGLVFTYVEGRRSTEILLAALCTSFIFASGLVKSVGKWWLVEMNVSEFWMPFLTGMCFIPGLLLSVYFIQQLPGPSQEDIAMRTSRPPLSANERRIFLQKYFPGLVLLVITYILLTAFRDFRDNFMAEIWEDLGNATDPGVFTRTEIPIALIVLTIMSLVVLIQSNKKAFLWIHILVLLGLLVTGISTLLFQSGLLSPFNWMVGTGLGLYMSYIPFNGILFDRMVAAFKYPGTAGFLVYVADSFGYLGSTGVLLYKNFGQSSLSWLGFFKFGSLTLSFTGILLMIGSIWYFDLRLRKTNLKS